LWINAKKYKKQVKHPVYDVSYLKTYDEIKKDEKIETESHDRSEGKYINLSGMLYLILRMKNGIGYYEEEFTENIYPSIIKIGNYNKRNKEDFLLTNAYEKYDMKKIIYITYIGTYKINEKYYDHYKYGSSNDYKNIEEHYNNKYETNITVYMALCEKAEEIKIELTKELNNQNVMTKSNEFDLQEKDEIFMVTYKFDLNDAKELIEKLIKTKQDKSDLQNNEIEIKKIDLLMRNAKCEIEMKKSEYNVEISKIECEKKKYEMEINKYELEYQKKILELEYQKKMLELEFTKSQKIKNETK